MSDVSPASGGPRFTGLISDAPTRHTHTQLNNNLKKNPKHWRITKAQILRVFCQYAKHTLSVNLVQLLRYRLHFLLTFLPLFRLHLLLLSLIIPLVLADRLHSQAVLLEQICQATHTALLDYKNEKMRSDVVLVKITSVPLYFFLLPFVNFSPLKNTKKW